MSRRTSRATPGGTAARHGRSRNARGAAPRTSRRAYDVVIVSDFRFSGGNTATLATEICAQAGAGYRTGLVQLPSASLRFNRPFSPKIRRCLDDGLATLELADQPLQAKLLIVRQPTVMATRPKVVPDVKADVKLLVANAPPDDGVRDTEYYDVGQVDEIAAEVFGDGVSWAPIGPVIREQLQRSPAQVRIVEHDWHNLIDVSAWSVPRETFVADRPVIGRHSRDHRLKWPASPDALLAAYPDDGTIGVRILGGADHAREILGYTPANWDVLPFDAVPPEQFLAGLDFFVNFPHPGLREAFGRNVLEAVASGAVAIVPPSFEPLFGSACLYGSPHDVKDLVHRLYRDKGAYDLQVRQGQQIVRERFDVRTHARRLATLIGPSGRRRRPSPTARDERPSVLFFATGGGLGHLTRTLAMAVRARESSPVVLTMSEAFATARDLGLPVEFLPSPAVTGLDQRTWNDYLERRLEDVIELYDARGLVFDGTMPYGGLLRVRRRHPDVPFIWCRRAMWKAGIGESSLKRGKDFNLIVEPGEFAASVDPGLTARARDDVVRVDPILLVDEEDLADRAASRERLGLDPARPAALVQMSAFDIETLRSRVSMVVDRLLELAGMQVYVPKSLMLGNWAASHPEVVQGSVYPISRYLRAFTLAVSAAGYNTFHELIRFGIPTIFVPLEETATDDQVARARYAERVGVALCAEEQDVVGLEERLGIISRPSQRSAMTRTARSLYPSANGAVAAVQAIENLIHAPLKAGRKT